MSAQDNQGHKAGNDNNLAVTEKLDHSPAAVANEYPLTKLFAVYVFVIPTIWYAVNYIAFPPAAPTAYGITLVLVGYYGYAFGMGLWAFMPALVYRGWLRISKKDYSKLTEFWLLITGVIISLTSLYGQSSI